MLRGEGPWQAARRRRDEILYDEHLSHALGRSHAIYIYIYIYIHIYGLLQQAPDGSRLRSGSAARWKATGAGFFT